MFTTANDLLVAHEDYSGYFLGTVVSNEDPLNLMRVQVSIPGLYDPSLGPVPWVGPIKDSPFGFGTGYGTYGCPQVGSTVIVEFQKGDPHRALYQTLPTALCPIPLFNNPNVWGFQDPIGNYQIYNLATKTYTFFLSSGVQISVDGSGNRTTSTKNDTENVNGNWTINVTGNANINVSGNATYKAALHQFNGPVQMDSTLVVDSTVAAGGSITDETSLGNTRTVADMRQVYDTHTHPYNDGNTGVPNQPI